MNGEKDGCREHVALAMLFDLSSVGMEIKFKSRLWRRLSRGLSRPVLIASPVQSQLRVLGNIAGSE